MFFSPKLNFSLSSFFYGNRTIIAAEKIKGKFVTLWGARLAGKKRTFFSMSILSKRFTHRFLFAVD
jgi:hypothetical protein